MKWLTLEKIKQEIHMEQDYHDEDEILEEYGRGAEDAILRLCNRTFEDLIEQYGDVPSQIRLASLMITANSYQVREPVAAQKLSPVPYGFDLMVKPFMKL